MNINLTNEQYAEEKARTSRRVTWVSVCVNLFLSIGQIALGLFSRSQALLADGIHSFSDLLADVVVLLAVKEGKKAPDNDHPYGHHRYENAATVALGALLILVSIGMIYGAINKFRQPELLVQVHSIALYAALFTLFAKESLFRYMLAAANRVRSGILVANAYHARSDAASSLLVAIGIGGNLAGLPILDPIAALCVGLMIIRSGWHFFRQGFNELTDQAADQKTIQQIVQTIATLEGVCGIHNVRSRKSGDWILMDIDIDVLDSLTVREGHDIAARVRDTIIQHFPVLKINIHIDPISGSPTNRLPENNTKEHQHG